MARKTPDTRYRLQALSAAVALFCTPLVLTAATPSSGSVDGTNKTTTWSGEIAKLPTGSASCAGPNDPACDNYVLTVADPGRPFNVVVRVDPQGGDWDLELYDSNGTLVDTSGNLVTQVESVEITTPGTYVVAAAPFAPNPALPYAATATMTLGTSGTTGPSTEPPVSFLTYAPPGLGEPDPDFQRFAPAKGPSGLGASAGEPTLGIPAANNRKRQATEPHKSRIMYLANLQTLRLEVDSSVSPAVGTWADKSCASHVATLDPILQVDPDTGRTISTQLNAKRSLICLSNDDGDTWTQSPQGAGVNAGVDHQTIGTGKFAASDALRQPDPLNPLVNYGGATYYASQDIAIAQTAQSKDGGFSWGVSYPMYNITQCGGLHGHLQVGADGTVYVPNGNCPVGQAGMARSTDGGITWTVHGVPGSVADDDPGMGIGRGDEVAGGRAFFGVCQNGKPTVATSDDRGDTWSGLQNVQGPHDINACVFPTMVAGDDDRAAFAFLGSSNGSAGAYGSDPSVYDGEWYLYVAVTYDGGQTWVTSNATPGDPVQRGPVCLQGTGCAGYRNLLDFNDIQLDEKGRIYVAYSDGCVGNCVTGGPNSLTDYTRIARQMEGTKSLFAAFDAELAPTTAVAPKSPYVEATRIAGNTVNLKWAAPYDGNSAITGYQVLRRIGNAGAFTQVAQVPATALGYTDSAVVAGTDYCYQVRAVNAVGASSSDYVACATAPVDLGSICVAPGLQLADDRSGELADGTSLGLTRLFGGEPFTGNPAACGVAPPSIVEFNVETGAALLPGNAVLLIWNRQTGAVASKIPLAQPDDRNMVSIRMVGNTAECRFGHVTGSATTSPLPSHGYDISAPFAAENCIVGSDGKIKVRVPTSVIDDGVVGRGYSFGGLEARSFAAQPVANATLPQPVLQTAAADFLATATFSLKGNEVCRPNFEPEAVDDTIASDFKAPVTFNALANDRANDCDTLKVVKVTPGAFGTTSIGADGRITYTPTKRNKCSDEFSYTIEDVKGGRDTGVVVVKGTAGRCDNDR